MSSSPWLSIGTASLRPSLRDRAVPAELSEDAGTGLGQFLHRVGAIEHEPKSLSDAFFADPRIASGR